MIFPESKYFYSFILAILLLLLDMTFPSIPRFLVILPVVYWIFSLDIKYLPSIAIVCSSGQLASLVNYAIVLVTMLHYQKLPNKALKILFFSLLSIFPIILYTSLLQVGQLDTKFSLSIGRYFSYFSLFAFFYGFIVKKNVDDSFFKQIITALLVCLILSYYPFANIMPRLNFLAIPLFLSGIFLVKESNLKAILVIGAGISIFRVATFTLILAGLLSLFYLYSYKKHSYKFTHNVTGVFSLFAITSFIILAILNSHGDYFAGQMEMAEVDSFNDFTQRFKYKLFIDRGILWNSVLAQALNYENWYMLPVDLPKISIINDYGSDFEVDVHSHNVYINNFRLYNFAVGSIINLIFIVMIFLGRKCLELKHLSTEELMVYSAIVSSNFIGSATGMYPVLQSYSVVGITMLGMGYLSYIESKKQ